MSKQTSKRERSTAFAVLEKGWMDEVGLIFRKAKNLERNRMLILQRQ